MTLSPREREVVILLGNGSDLTYNEVAERLGIALSTVRRHVDRIMIRNPSDKRPLAALRDLYDTMGTPAKGEKAN